MTPRSCLAPTTVRSQVRPRPAGDADTLLQVGPPTLRGVPRPCQARRIPVDTALRLVHDEATEVGTSGGTSRDTSGIALADTLSSAQPRLPSEHTELGAGARVGRFLIQELRSRGGFASVYRALDETAGRLVALKVLHPHLATSPNLVRRFATEADLIRRLAHPNIVTLEGFGALADGRRYLAMEWIDGHSLQEEIRMRGRFNLSETLAVARQLTWALAAAHAVGVVHRDVKASNVMVVPHGDWFDVKLVDFGIAKILAPENPDHTGLTTTGARMGTPHNMAPEQILARTVDARTDIYAFGVLLYQLLTGEHPFDAASAVEIEEMHLRTPAPRASEVAPVPRAIEAVILTCLEKDPDRRFASAPALLEALEQGAAAARRLPAGADELRPSQRLRVRAERAIAVHVDARTSVEDDDVDDDLLDALDAAIEAARDALASLELDVVGNNSGSSLLFVGLLPEGCDDRERRRRVLSAALCLDDLVADDRIELAVTLHVDRVLVVTVEGRNDCVGGKLLAVADWVSDGRGAGVVATAEALDGLGVPAEPVAGERPRLRVQRG